MGLFGKRGAVRVELERSLLYPGDAVAGTVFLSVDKPIKAASLKVLVYGKEVMMWKRKIGASTMYHSKTKDHFNQEMVLVEENTPFVVGETQYHFVCGLPPDAQPSFSYAAERVQDLDRVCVDTEYKVDAILEVKGLGASNLEGQAVFTVEAPPQHFPQPQAISTTHTSNVAFLSLFKRGSCALTLHVATNAFVPSSTIYAQVDLTLDGASALKYVKLVLYEDAVVDRRDSVFTGLKSGSRVVSKRRYDPSELGGAAPWTLALAITPNEISKDKPLNPTMTAHFLTVRYRLAVECHFSMAHKVSVDAPVTILRETAHVPGNVKPPLAEMAIEAATMLATAIAG